MRNEIKKGNEEKITVQQLLDLCKEKSKDEIVSTIIATRYVPIDVKKAVIKLMIDTLGKESVSYTATYSSIDKYLTYIISVLQLYTKLDIQPKQVNQDLDLLMSNSLITPIFDAIGEDVREYKAMYEMGWQDYIRDHNSLEAIISRELHNFNLNLQENMVKSAENLDMTDVLKDLIEKSEIKKE